MLGLYIHVPFCSAICNYCNFNRGLFDAELKARYVDALITEIRNQSAIRNPQSAMAADTIYFGGGTPSLLEPGEIARIIRACDEAFDVAVDCEVTMEANPETVTQARLAAFRAAGVDRLSFGVQSFREDELRRLARLEDAGLEQYEISNVARQGRRSRHNLKYWTDGEWLGFGCGAHSTRDGSRWKNISSTAEYIAAVARGASPAVDIRQLTPAEQL